MIGRRDEESEDDSGERNGIRFVVGSRGAVGSAVEGRRNDERGGWTIGTGSDACGRIGVEETRSELLRESPLL